MDQCILNCIVPHDKWNTVNRGKVVTIVTVERRCEVQECHRFAIDHAPRPSLQLVCSVCVTIVTGSECDSIHCVRVRVNCSFSV